MEGKQSHYFMSEKMFSAFHCGSSVVVLSFKMSLIPKFTTESHRVITIAFGELLHATPDWPGGRAQTHGRHAHSRDLKFEHPLEQLSRRVVVGRQRWQLAAKSRGWHKTLLAGLQLTCSRSPAAPSHHRHPCPPPPPSDSATQHPTGLNVHST